jgi:hypothetical protein
MWRQSCADGGVVAIRARLIDKNRGVAYSNLQSSALKSKKLEAEAIAENCLLGEDKCEDVL